MTFEQALSLVLPIIFGLMVLIICGLRKEREWFKSRADYWYQESRLWREMWEAERTGDYTKLREVQELRKLEARSKE